jgi:hypothetical protein
VEMPGLINVLIEDTLIPARHECPCMEWAVDPGSAPLKIVTLR